MKRILLLSALVGLAVECVSAADGTWTNDLPGVWRGTTNWLNGVVADGVGAKATIAPLSGGSVTITLDDSRTIGELEPQVATVITNDGVDSAVLTFSGSSGTPKIIPTADLTIGRVRVSGNQGLLIDGLGSVTLFKENGSPSNTITGGLTLSGGTTLFVGGAMVDGYTEAVPLAVGSLGSVTFLNGTLNLRPSASTVEPGTAPVTLDLHVPEGASGTLVLPLRWTGSSGDGVAAPGPGLGGTLTGKGTLTVDSRYVRGNIVGNWSDFEGTLRIYSSYLGSGQVNDFRYAGGPGFPKATLEFFGSYPFTFRYYLGLSSNTILPIGRLVGTYSDTYVAGSATAAYTLFWRIGDLMTDPNEEVTFAGAFVDGAGPCGVIYVGAGKWILTGNSTHTGGFVISNGIVQVGDGWSESGAIGNGQIANYSKLVFARGGTLFIDGPLTGSGIVSNVGPATLILRSSNTFSGPVYVSQGSVLFGPATRATGAVSVESGAGVGVWTKTTDSGASIGNLTLKDGSTLAYDFNEISNPTVPVLTNGGVLNIQGTVTVNISGTRLGLGTIPLLKYGTRTGGGSFVLGALPSHVTQASLQDDMGSGLLSLVIAGVFDPTLVWKGDVQGVWDFTGQEWVVAGSGVRTNYYDTAMVRFDDTAVRTTIQLDSYVSPARVTFANNTKDFVLTGSGQIAGSPLFVKEGRGKVTLNNVNSFGGGMAIKEGVLQVGDGVAQAQISASGNITNNGVIIFNSAAANTISAVISSENTTNMIIQRGPGDLTLSGANTFVGTVEVRPGAFFYNNHGSAIGGNGSRLLLTGGTAYLRADIWSGREVVVAAPSVIGSDASNRRIDSPIYGTNTTLVLSNAGLLTIHASLRGFSGRIVLGSQSSAALRFNAGGTVCDGSPTAVFEFQPAPGTTNWLYNRNAGVTYLGGIHGGFGVIDQQSTSGGANLVTYLVGDAGVDNVFNGIIQDSSRNTAFIKVGPASLTLSNCILNHKGTFGVSNGVLRFVGTTVVSPVTTNVIVVAPGILDLTGADTPTLSLGQGTVVQPLRGNGTIRGNVVLGANARLLPGREVDGTTGVLTVEGNVTLGGLTLMELNRDATPTCDRLVANSIVAGGQLVVTNIGSPLQAGDTFQLFSKPVSGFTAVVLPQLSAPLYWTNKLAIDGTIQVLSTVATTPTNITYRVAEDGQLEISWPASHIGWKLQVQTNTLAVGLSTNWVDVSGSELTNRMRFQLGGTNQATFYRLILRQ